MGALKKAPTMDGDMHPPTEIKEAGEMKKKPEAGEIKKKKDQKQTGVPKKVLIKETGEINPKEKVQKIQIRLDKKVKIQWLEKEVKSQKVKSQKVENHQVEVNP